MVNGEWWAAVTRMLLINESPEKESTRCRLLIKLWEYSPYHRAVAQLQTYDSYTSSLPSTTIQTKAFYESINLTKYPMMWKRIDSELTDF